MGLFGVFCFKNKRKEKWYIHRYDWKGRSGIFYMSKEEKGAIELPMGFEVVESPKSEIPMLRKIGTTRKEE